MQTNSNSNPPPPPTVSKKAKTNAARRWKLRVWSYTCVRAESQQAGEHYDLYREKLNVDLPTNPNSPAFHVSSDDE